jgi:hypothetical protein
MVGNTAAVLAQRPLQIGAAVEVYPQARVIVQDRPLEEQRLRQDRAVDWDRTAEGRRHSPWPHPGFVQRRFPDPPSWRIWREGGGSENLFVSTLLPRGGPSRGNAGNAASGTVRISGVSRT